MPTNIYGTSCTPNLGGVSDYYTKSEINQLFRKRRESEIVFLETNHMLVGNQASVQQQYVLDPEYFIVNHNTGSVSNLSADRLRTARTLSLTGAVTGTVSSNLATGFTINTTVTPGSITSAMISDGTITDTDISANAEIAVSKLADGTARQLIQTAADGTTVEWTSNVDVPGTLDVTGIATFDNKVTIGVAEPTSVREIGWNTDEGTYDIRLDSNVLHRLGADQTMLCRNNSNTVAIPKGTAVMFAGTVGNSGRIKVAPMVANGTVPGYVFFGVTESIIPAGGDGYVKSFGEIKGINTNAYPEQSILWCNPAVPGGFTATEPAAPNLKLAVAAVISSANNGILMVRWDTGRRLKDLHDVEASGTTVDGDVLRYNAALARWENSSNISISGNLSIGSSITFEGATANDFETVLSVVDPTADRAISIPNQSGNLLVSGNASIVDGDISATAAISYSKLALPVSTVSLNNQRISSLATPVSDNDAVNKTYVDSTVQGLLLKDSVQAATTGPITLTGLQTVDGVVLVAGNRVLVKNQSTASGNGLYQAASGPWSRTTDADENSEVRTGLYVFVEGGSVNVNSGWVLSTTGSINIGTTPLVFSKFSGAGQILAGDGLVKIGEALTVATNGVTSTMIANDTIVDGDINVNANIAGSKIAPASTSSRGTVQLVDSVSSSSVTTAATPNSVKSAYDLANAAQQLAAGLEFGAGTVMLFQQTSAPTGWTKITTHDNKALRVVSGSAGSGGATPFTSVFASRTPAGAVSGSVSGYTYGGGVQGHTLSWNEMPVHNHGHRVGSGNGSSTIPAMRTLASGVSDSSDANNIQNSGGNWAHAHGFSPPAWAGSFSGSFSGSAMDFNVQYVDVIFASKN